jgi:hypothetical protein
MIQRQPRITTNFTVIPNQILNDSRLSLRAKGLLVYILSKPDHWRTSTAHLASIGPEGRQAIQSTLRELEHTGYVVRRRYQDPQTGQWRYDTLVFDCPHLGTRPPEQLSTDHPQPQSTSPAQG